MRFLFLLFICLPVVTSASETKPIGMYYEWGLAPDGWGYCFQYTMEGHVLNGGHPVSELYCDYYNPPYFTWLQGPDAFTHCFKKSPQGYTLNRGRPVPDEFCY